VLPPVRNRGGSRLLRGATIAMGTVVGMMLGTVRTTQVITKRVDTLSNDSYIKKLANSVSAKQANRLQGQRKGQRWANSRLDRISLAILL
jgi:hypothetical protein